MAAFDTLKVADSLETSGMSQDTARVVAGGIGQAVENRDDALATKEYVLKVAFGIVTANVAITFGLLKLLLP